MAWLVRTHPTAGERFALKYGSVLGRATDCDIRIDHPAISRHHARFTWSEDGWVVEDLRSTNPISINDVHVVRSARLRAGDVLRVGFDMFELVDDVAAAFAGPR